MLAAAHRMLHPMWRDLARQQALAHIERFAARLARRLATGSVASNPPPANFQGNLTGIQAPSADALVILRQADCSVNRRALCPGRNKPDTGPKQETKSYRDQTSQLHIPHAVQCTALQVVRREGDGTVEQDFRQRKASLPV
jgi:hypothetical protein